MISIKAVSLNGQPLTSPTSAVFDERGGTLGRKDDCTLVLPDPERVISRHHAQIDYRGGQYVVRDQGTGTPVFVNRQALGNGNEAVVRPGDELRIGGYVLQVEAVQAQSAPQPVLANDDPFAAFALKPPAASQASPFGSDTTSGGSANHAFIPKDFDPFADLKPTPNVSSVTASDLGSGMGVNNPSQSIDALFGLSAGGSAGSDPFGINTTAPSHSPQSSISTDPLAAMGFSQAAKVDTTPVQRNDTPEIYGSFKLPEIKLEPLNLTEPTAARPLDLKGERAGEPTGSHAGLSDVTGAFAVMGAEQNTIYQPTAAAQNSAESQPKDDPLALFGFDKTDTPASTNPLEIRERSAVKVAPVTTATNTQAGVTPEITPTAHAAISPQINVAANSSSADANILLQQFLNGLGIPDLEINGGITPEFMFLLGKLMREMTQGTLDLLLARTLTKREVRAEMTMIEVRENNPLKFSPTVEVALTHLLAPTMRGFLPPLKAVKGAYDDLRSHQLGFMAGIQGALAGVLERFNPEQLEKRLTQKSVIDSLLPMNRRAKLWDLFSDLYEEISKEAEDDFHALFGKEFVKAYEDQISKLEQEDT